MLCGHFLIPFWTFFSATLIGKAFFKATIQALFMVALAQQSVTDAILSLFQSIPSIHQVLSSVIEQQRAQFDMEETGEDTSVLGTLWQIMVTVMILYFVIGCLETLAMRQLKKQQ